MKYNTYTPFILLMVCEQHRDSHCRFPSSLHLSLDLVKVKVQSQFHASGAEIPLKRPCARPAEHLYVSINEEARSSMAYHPYWVIIFQVIPTIKC